MRSNRLRVCHLIHRLQPGGAEDVLVELARVSASAGLDMSVLAMVGDVDTEHGEALRRAGIRVESLRLPNRWDPRGPARGLRAVRRLAPDVIHTHLKHADVIGSWAATHLGVPHVSTLHVIEDGGSVLGVVKRAIASTVRGTSADAVIAVSDAQRQWYQDAYPHQAALVRTIHNGVTAPPPLPSARRAELRREMGAEAGEILVLNAAVMRPGKGHDTLLDAVRLLPADSPVKFALAGDGELAAVIAHRVATDPELAGRVRLLGFRTDVPELLQAADMLTQPSDHDALPTVLIQAQAAGVPAVATEVGGIPEIVAAGSGRLVPARDPLTLASVLDDLARTPERRAAMACAAKASFAARFDAREWAARLRDLYEGLRSGTQERQPPAFLMSAEPVRGHRPAVCRPRPPS